MSIKPKKPKKRQATLHSTTLTMWRTRHPRSAKWKRKWVYLNTLQLSEQPRKWYSFSVTDRKRLSKPKQCVNKNLKRSCHNSSDLKAYSDLVKTKLTLTNYNVRRHRKIKVRAARRICVSIKLGSRIPTVKKTKTMKIVRGRIRRDRVRRSRLTSLRTQDALLRSSRGPNLLRLRMMRYRIMKKL